MAAVAHTTFFPVEKSTTRLLLYKTQQARAAPAVAIPATVLLDYQQHVASVRFMSLPGSTVGKICCPEKYLPVFIGCK